MMVPKFTQFLDARQQRHTFMGTLPSGQFIFQDTFGRQTAHSNFMAANLQPKCDTIVSSTMGVRWYLRAARLAAECPGCRCPGHQHTEKRLACAVLGDKAKVVSFDAGAGGGVFPAGLHKNKIRQVRNAARLLSEKTAQLKLRGVTLEKVIKEFSYPFSRRDSYSAWQTPVYIVGGAVRDALMGRADDINDIDIATPYGLMSARERLVDIFSREGVTLSENNQILHATSLRAQMGMLYVAKLDLEDSPLDVGVLKAKAVFRPHVRGQKPVPIFEYATQPSKDTKKRDMTSAYNSGLSLKLDSEERDFSFNAVFFDMTNNVAIDVSGFGFDDVPQEGATMIRPVAQATLVETDFGGVIRFLRFISTPQKYRSQNEAWEVVCGGLEAMMNCVADCPYTKFLTNPLDEDLVAAFKLYKIYSKLFKPNQGRADINNVVRSTLEAIPRRGTCERVPAALRRFFNSASAAKALGDFPAELPKSDGVFTMYHAFKNALGDR
jgi:hypothetical protein